MSTGTLTSSLADDLEIILAQNPNKRTISPLEVTSDKTLALLQQERILKSEKTNIEIRDALTEHGATVNKCAEVLSFIIQDINEKADVRRRAIADVLTLHNAMPKEKTDPAPQAIQIVIQTSEHVNLANVLNPTFNRESQY